MYASSNASDPRTVASEILRAVADQYGIRFSETGTGGGCMALEARLESGHWIVATDDGLCGFAERIDAESYEDSYNSFDGDPRALGWFIGVYENDAESDTWMGQSSDALINVTDYDAYAADLPRLVGVALEQFRDSARAVTGWIPEDSPILETCFVDMCPDADAITSGPIATGLFESFGRWQG